MLCKHLGVILAKLQTDTEPLGDHDPYEQKLNFLIASFTGELFNFAPLQNNHEGFKDQD